jgi:hypothetical protein
VSGQQGGADCAMVIGVGLLVLRLHACHSLKEKRGVVKAVIARIRNQFNASVAEVGANDDHHQARIGFSLVGNEKPLVDAKINKLFNFVDALGLAELVDTQMEIIVV